MRDMKTQKYGTRESLLEISRLHADWWFFPEEPSVHGFLGTGKIFIVGDQPSTDLWPETHPHRRAFYNLLKEESAGDCHLTDFYKRRGFRGELRNGFDPVKHSDYAEHLKVFHWEVEFLRPSTILAMGRIAEQLLKAHTDYSIKYVLHFGVMGYANDDRDKLARRLVFEKCLRGAITAAR